MGGRRVARSLSILLLFVAGLCRAAELPVPAVPAPPSVPAQSYVLVDHLTGAVLAEHDADRQRPPASLTKLMTAYLAFEALNDGALRLDEHVIVSEKAWRMSGSRMFIEVGNEVAVEDLLRGLIVQSGNDAAIALAERIAGSEEAFVALMNERAATLGMTSTTFRNPTGLPAAGHLSSARDLARLAGAVLEDFPEFRALFAEQEFTYNGIRQYNRNRLLRRDESVDGLKTGYTASAGYCVVTTAERSGMRLVSVVLGAETTGARFTAAQRLLDYGFGAYETHKLFAKGEPIRAAKVWKGVVDSAPVGLARDLYVTIPRGAYDALSAVLSFRAELVAPLEAELEIGNVSISLGSETLSTVPVVLLETVSLGGTWTRVKDDLVLRFRANE
jgi:D-alanyl-D-alanine carboxypeptidase (penicillin-binding protein 5/6)